MHLLKKPINSEGKSRPRNKWFWLLTLLLSPVFSQAQNSLPESQNIIPEEKAADNEEADVVDNGIEDKDGRERFNRLEYSVSAEATFSTGSYTPFWLVSNRQGLGAPHKNNGYGRAWIAKKLDPDYKFSWGAAVDIDGAWNIPASFNIHQLYGELKYRGLYAYAGAKEYWGSYNDPRLSSGNLLFSGNAMPIPQVRVGTYEFVPFWGTKNWFWVKGYLAYGKFTDSKWQESWANPEYLRTSNVLYCSRGLWLRGGNTEKFPLLVDIGIEMGTQFGGTIYREGSVLHMPTKFIDWLKAIVPLSGNDDTPEGEQTNVQGNMVGEYYITLQWIPNSDWSVKAYFEHYFEDHSQLTFEYGWKDAQWGVEVTLPKNRFVSKVVAEYIYMKDQTGSVNHDWTPEIPEQVSGGDNYYNHYLYGAWQNWGMSIGTPLALSPLYNRNHWLYIYDNRFIAYHIGLEGHPFNGFGWRALFTATDNWGTYRFPYKDVLHNFSGLVEFSYSPKNWKGWYADLGLAWDSGSLIGKNFGAMVKIGKTGLIKW